MLAYIYDFLSILFDKLKGTEKIRNIILFGSVARGNPRKDSDIDLFIDVDEKNKEEVDKVVKESLNEFELKTEKTWKLKGIKNPLSLIIDNLEREQWKELKRDIGSYGKVLFGIYHQKKEGKRKILISYDMSKLKQKDKMKIIRKLHGYKLKRGKKLYEQKGILYQLHAEKLLNALLIDQEHYKKVVDLLRIGKVPLKIIEIWSE